MGLYTPSEAAYLARVSTQMMKRWIHGSKSGIAAVRAQLTDDSEKMITFLDFIQTLAIRAIRKDNTHRITLQKIREFIRVAKDEYGIDYPFARRHTTYAFNDDIVLSLSGEESRIIQITGRYKNQDMIRPVVELYMEDLSYDPSGLARKYTPFSYHNREIIINPEIRFGEPILYPSGISAFALTDAARSEGSIEAAAEAYEVDRDDIIASLKYEDYLDDRVS